jgi:hypothetical protein
MRLTHSMQLSPMSKKELADIGSTVLAISNHPLFLVDSNYLKRQNEE